MGDVVQWGLIQLISQGLALYPSYSDEPAERWEVVNVGFSYTVTDRAGGTTVSMPNELIFESTDLITWFGNHLWDKYEA
jgi:hypothetical protein